MSRHFTEYHCGYSASLVNNGPQTLPGVNGKQWARGYGSEHDQTILLRCSVGERFRVRFRADADFRGENTDFEK